MRDTNGLDGDMAMPTARDTAPSEPSPAVSGKAGIAIAWRTDSPPFGKRPIWQFVFIQGEKYHSGHTWMRSGWGTAAIRVNHASDGYRGFRRSDIERICRDNDIDFDLGPVVVGWLPMSPPALLTEVELPALALCDDGEWAAQAIDTRRAETNGLGAQYESAVRQDAPHLNQEPTHDHSN